MSEERAKRPADRRRGLPCSRHAEDQSRRQWQRTPSISQSSSSQAQCLNLGDLEELETKARDAVASQEAVWRGNLMCKKATSVSKIAPHPRRHTFPAEEYLEGSIPPPLATSPKSHSVPLVHDPYSFGGLSVPEPDPHLLTHHPYGAHEKLPAPAPEPPFHTLVHNPYALDGPRESPKPVDDLVDPPLPLPAFPYVSGASVRPQLPQHLDSRGYQLPSSSWARVPPFGRAQPALPSPPPSPPASGPRTSPITSQQCSPLNPQYFAVPAAMPQPLSPLLTSISFNGPEEVYPVGWHDSVPIAVTRKGPPRPPPLPCVAPIANILHQYKEARQGPVGPSGTDSPSSSSALRIPHESQKPSSHATRPSSHTN